MLAGLHPVRHGPGGSPLTVACPAGTMDLTDVNGAPDLVAPKTAPHAVPAKVRIWHFADKYCPIRDVCCQQQSRLWLTTVDEAIDYIDTRLSESEQKRRLVQAAREVLYRAEDNDANMVSNCKLANALLFVEGNGS